jgi:hypothetical protein
MDELKPRARRVTTTVADPLLSRLEAEAKFGGLRLHEMLRFAAAVGLDELDRRRERMPGAHE